MLDFLADLMAGLLYLFAIVLGKILNVIIYIFVIIAQYNHIIDAAPVNQGWVIVRDLCNMFFVVVLLVIAFGTVLKIETYHYKKLLPKLLLMALLINFSKTIAGLFIDFAQVIMLTFVAGFSAIARGNLVNALHVQDYLTFGQTNTQGAKALDSLGASLLALVVLIISLIVVIIMTLILAFRIIALWILVILSPLAYLLAIIPKGQQYAQQWWTQFTKYLIVGPVMAFFLWLSLSTSVAVQDKLFKEIPASQQKPDAAVTKIGTVENLGGFIIGICLLIGSLLAAQQIGVVGSKMAGDWAGRIQRGNIPGLSFAGRRADMWRMKAGEAIRGGEEAGKLRKVIGGAFLPSISMRPTVWKKALQKREEKLQRRYYSEPTGVAQNVLNYVTRSRERKIDYKAVGRGTAVVEELREIEASVPYDTELNRKMTLDSIKAGDTLMSQALIIRAVKNTDVNETTNSQKTLDFMENDFEKNPAKYRKFGITDISQFVDSPAVRQAFISLITRSEEEAIELASRIGGQEFSNGNFHLSSMVIFDEEAGKMRFASPEEQGKVSAGITSLLPNDEILKKMKRIGGYEGVSRDEETGKRKGTYRYEDETRQEREGIVLRNAKTGKWESIVEEEKGKIIPESQVSFKRELSKGLTEMYGEFIFKADWPAMTDQITKMKPQGMEGVLTKEGETLDKFKEAIKESKTETGKERIKAQLNGYKSFISRVKEKSGRGATAPIEVEFPEGVDPATAKPIITNLRKVGTDIVTSGGLNEQLLDSLETQLKQFEKVIAEKVGGETKKSLQGIINKIRESGKRVSDDNWDEFKEETSGNLGDLIKILTQGKNDNKKQKKEEPDNFGFGRPKQKPGF